METSPINDLDYNAQRILILGTTGTGKTTCASRLIHLHPADLVLIYDWQAGEFAHRLGVLPSHTRDAVALRIEQGQRIVCYDPQIPFGGDMDQVQADDFAWFCEMAMEVGGQMPGVKLVVIDEAHDLMSVYKIPWPLRGLLARGRRRRIDTILVASAANAVHSTGRNQVSELYCFKCTDENALEYPVSLGLDKQEVKDLPKTHFIHKDNESGEMLRLALWDENANAGEPLNPEKEIPV